MTNKTVLIGRRLSAVRFQDGSQFHFVDGRNAANRDLSPIERWRALPSAPQVPGPALKKAFGDTK